MKDISPLKLSKKTNSKKDKIILFGFPLHNMGVQALTFTAVDQLKRRFPDQEIYFFNTQDFLRPEREKELFNFKILPWELDTKLRLLGISGRLFNVIFQDKWSKEIENRIKDVLKNSFCAIDISGYSLSSQWKFSLSVHYLLNITIAKKFNIPFYILPQSFGPFHYSFLQRIFLFPLIKFYLNYPEKVFVRERDGLKWIGKFRRKDVELSYDMVLLNREYNLKNIYKNEIQFRKIEIEPNSVGIIPNIRVLERTKKEILYPIYCAIINRIVDSGRKVYLLMHSKTESEIIGEIFEFFKENDNVKLLTDELNVFEMVNVIKKFDFIVTSRYHSIVHAYKNGVPALAIGWSEKYPEIMGDFGQLDYYFDVRNDLKEKEILKRLQKLLTNYREEREKIIKKYSELPPLSNVFDVFLPG